MGQQIIVKAPPRLSEFPLKVTPTQIRSIKTIEIDNGSSLTLTLTGDGSLIRVVPPYVSRVLYNSAGGWGAVEIAANGVPIQTTDILNVAVYDQILPPLAVPSFGVSAWGGGAVPNHLINVNPGDSILAPHVQQIINLLTGVMTGQRVSLVNVGASGLPLNNTVPLSPPVGTSIVSAGDAASAFTVTGLPASAVAVALSVQLVCATIGASALIFRSLADAGLPIGGTSQITTAAQASRRGFAAGACVPGAANQLGYSVAGTGGAAWTLNLSLTEYLEPT